MTLSSMTGFARTDGSWGDYRWTWELKSVNGKGLDVRFRLPSGMDALERQARAVISGALDRGNVNANLQLTSDGAGGEVRVNEAVLTGIIKAAQKAAEKHGLKKPRVEELMGLRGVLEIGEGELTEEEAQDRDAALLESLAQCVADLMAMRQAEGEAMASLIAGQIDDVEALTGKARACASSQPDAIRERLHTQIRDLLAGSGAEMDEARLAQEAAFLAVKADVREELDRLAAHVSAARDLLRTGSPVGRKLDFLSQEFGREANTVCSKAADGEMSEIGLALKAVIDQMREQVQNIE